MKLLSFRGGIHPPGEKDISKSATIEKLPLPEMLYVPLSQHAGAPANPVVNKGDEVKAGTLIGELAGFISANVHSPVSGKVLKILPYHHFLGKKSPAIQIQVEGEEPVEGYGESREYDNLSGKELVEIVKDAGIVGMGGAMFPTYVKLSPPPEKKIDTVIINGAECEPYLTSDYRLMMERTEDILMGTEIIQKILNPEKVYIGIESNKMDAVKKFQDLLKGEKQIEVIILKTKYPQGSEKHLIKAITNREVPSGGLPFDVGCYVQNVGTAIAIYEAVRFKKPLTHRVVTITGAVKTPKNIYAPIGVPIKKLIEFSDGYLGEPGKLISGGPMMGISLYTDEIPIIKGTSGILVQRQDEVVMDEASPCIRCAHCVDACPMGLTPNLMADYIEAGKIDMAENIGVMDCIECGTCAYVCTTKRHLVQHFKFAKKEIMKNRRKNA